MLTNKWIQFALSALVALTGAISATDWTAVLSTKTAGGIAVGIGVVKMILNAVAPAAGQIVTPTNGSVITHTSTGT